MEARKITIVATREQKKYVINSEAETLLQLKRDLEEAGIDYTDMTFMEGLTRTEIKDNNSILPTNVKRINRETGEEITTNELVFMLTNTSKKIQSGAVVNISRAEIYIAIKNNNLENACVTKYGKNFTQCTTEELLTLIVMKAKELDTNTSHPTNCEYKDIEARAAIKELVEKLAGYGHISLNNANIILSLIKDKAPTCKDTTTSTYSDSEIEDMFRGL